MRCGTVQGASVMKKPSIQSPYFAINCKIANNKRAISVIPRAVDWKNPDIPKANISTEFKLA